jgi:hypothetical protein
MLQSFVSQLLQQRRISHTIKQANHNKKSRWKRQRQLEEAALQRRTTASCPVRDHLLEI